MNKTSIDWPGLTHTWNPGYGCLRGCSYCYAKDLHNKRMAARAKGRRLPKQYESPFNVMQFFPERLKIPRKSRVIKRVFVGDMTDICYWEPSWIEKVLQVIRERPGIEFMFLTKDPFIYSAFDFPENCWLGQTITFEEKKPLFFLSASNKTFLSIEPILGKPGNSVLIQYDLIIVGAMTGPGAVVPRKEWISSIKHPNIYYKKNIRKYL